MTTRFQIAVGSNIAWTWESPVIAPWVKSEENIVKQLFWSKEVPIYEASPSQRFFATKVFLTTPSPTFDIKIKGTGCVVMLDGSPLDLSVLKGMYIETNNLITISVNTNFIFNAGSVSLGQGSILQLLCQNEDLVVPNNTTFTFQRTTQDATVSFVVWGN